MFLILPGQILCQTCQFDFACHVPFFSVIHLNQIKYEKDYGFMEKKLIFKKRIDKKKTPNILIYGFVSLKRGVLEHFQRAKLKS